MIYLLENLKIIKLYSRKYDNLSKNIHIIHKKVKRNSKYKSKYSNSTINKINLNNKNNKNILNSKNK